MAGKIVKVVMELRLSVPEEADAPAYVYEYFTERAHQRACEVFAGMQIVDVEEIDPWAPEPWDASVWGDDLDDDDDNWDP